MQTPQANEETGNLALVRDVIRGAEGAWEQFVRRQSHLIYSLCDLVFSPGTVADEFPTILARLRADDFAILRSFDGRAKLSTYLTLKIGDVVASRLVDLFREDPERGWKAFETFFKNDISRIIAKQFPFPAKYEALDDGSSREDLYQDICLLLVEQSYRRIMSYDGRGSFTGYVRRIVQNLCVDLLRKTEGRRRVPEKILQLSELEQEVFKLLHWRGCPDQDLFNILCTQGDNKYSTAQVEQATIRVREALLSGRSGYKGHAQGRADSSHIRSGKESRPQPEIPAANLTPEAVLIEIEKQATRERALESLKQAIAELPPDERLYIRLRYYTTPAKSSRDVARLMGRSEEEIYKLRQKAVAKLKVALITQKAGQIPEMSV